MEKTVGIGLFALLVVGVAFVQVHYYRERQRAKAECERLEQSIGQMQKQYVDVVKQNQSYRQMNHELKKYQWLVQVMRENMGTDTHGQLLELVLQKKIQEAEHKQITCDVQGTLNGNLRMDEMSLVSLVMNLLDNAIEACVQTETRQIQVVIAEDPAAQMLELKLQNSKNSSQKLHANEAGIGYQTTKEDRGSHGYGKRMTQDEFSCLYEENSFTCIIKKGLAMLDGDRIRIEHIDSDMEVLTIPDELPVTLFDIQGRSYTRILPVSELGKKACYEKKNLKQVRLGKNFRFLDDYAFARCEHLTEVVAEGIDGFADLRLGNGVFDDCGSLEILALDGDREAKIARLLAAVPRFLKAEDLLTGGEIGTDAWYERWDFALRAFLKEDDVAGYMQAVLFGKRKFADREAYIAYVQEAKRALCRLRLEYGEELQAFARKQCEEYLGEMRQV